MATIDDGGPAYPRPDSTDTSRGTLQDRDSLEGAQTGMSLRVYIATKAMQTMLGDRKLIADLNKSVGSRWKEAIVCGAFSMADAMIAEMRKS